jgi:hypothetical protein
MATLREQLGEPPKRTAVIQDATRVLDAEVADKGGLGGMAIKAAYKVIKGIKPGFVEEVIDNLMNDFLNALDPIYQEALTNNASPASHLEQNKGRVAEGLLAITDERAKRAQRAVVRSTYDKLRPSAKKHVEAAAPRLGQMLARHAATSN